jgi:hypothetical protein
MRDGRLWPVNCRKDTVDANAGRHQISPDIHGINFYWDLGSASDSQRAAHAAAALDIRSTGRRWGGNSTSTYHWKFDVDNLDADWFYEVLPDTSVNGTKLPEGSSNRNCPGSNPSASLRLHAPGHFRLSHSVYQDRSGSLDGRAVINSYSSVGPTDERRRCQPTWLAGK